MAKTFGDDIARALLKTFGDDAVRALATSGDDAVRALVTSGDDVSKMMLSSGDDIARALPPVIDKNALRTIVRNVADDFADEWKGVNDNGLAGHTDRGYNGSGDVGPLITEIKYTPSSGATLKVNLDKTTTVLGSFEKDMKNIIEEMGNVKSTYTGARNGGFNVLNVPDDIFKSLTREQFWQQYNKPWLDEAIRRGDDIVLATKPTGRVISYIDINTGKEIITGFGREYNYLLGNGYVYNKLTNMMIKK